MRRAALVLSLAAPAPVLAVDDDPYGISQWPPDPEFTALTNHLTSCYNALALRYQAVGRTDGPPGPSFVFPYNDYLQLGLAIDSLCSRYGLLEKTILFRIIQVI